MNKNFRDTEDGISEAGWEREMRRDYFDFAVEQARRVNAAIQQAKQGRQVCPSCGGDLSGEVARDGREDETCGSPHCRESWYGEVAERY